jgi:glutamate synthase (NADPH/NADH) small chain
MIIYRRSEEEMPAYKYEYELAKRDGVIFHWLTTPQRILGNGYVEGLECTRMSLGEPDASGRRRPVPIPNSEFTIQVDMVIKSLGQKANESLLSQIAHLRIQDGKVLVDPETMQTSNPKVFAGGDCINGGKEVVNAAADGKKAAHGIDGFLFPERYAGASIA